MAMTPTRLKSIIISTCDHLDQRYPTAGDWTIAEAALTIRISRLPNSIHEYPLIIHELAEALLCHASGIDTATVDRWDFTHQDSSDPGLDIHCPYHTQHLIATDLEYRMVHALGLNEAEYNDSLRRLDEGPQPRWPGEPSGLAEEAE